MKTFHLPLLTSHMIAVLSTEAEAIKFPSAAQQISYTSSKWPLEARKDRGKKLFSQKEKNKKFKGKLHNIH